MSLQMNLTKAGEVPVKLSLNLKKSESFTVKLGWDGSNDLDIHAFHCVNRGQGAKVSAFEDVLSPYNIARVIKGESVGILPLKADKSFEIYGGALVHSPDATDGTVGEVDEFVRINPSMIKVPAGTVVEIPLIAMIHPQHGTVKFKDVLNPIITIEDSDGKKVFDASLSSQFGDFVGVQMGSVIVEENGTVSFCPVAVGFNQDFNQVLGHFS